MKFLIGLITALFLVAIPQTAFADSVKFETRMDTRYINFVIDEDGTFTSEGKDGMKTSTLTINIEEDTTKEVINYLKTKIIPEDKINYIQNETLNDLTYSKEAYILTICEDSSCKSYYSDEHLMLTTEEIENGGLYTPIERALEETITNVATTAFGIIKFAMYAIIGIPMIIVFIVILLKIKRYTNLDNQNIKENNRFQKKNKKSFRNNDDPFSL